ncbi:MAG: ethanolamine ammonia-lyase subunit EutC [Clostridiaceae bacterium]
MDTEQIVELILQEIQAARFREHPVTSFLPADKPEAERTTEPLREAVRIPAPNAAPSAQPCDGAICPGKLRASEETQAALLKKMQQSTSARIGIGKCGPRLRTASMLQFRADHAAAKDAVLCEVPEELLTQMGLFTAQTLCSDREEYLATPDLGRKFSRETLDMIAGNCPHGVDVQIYAAGGLSSSAMTANLANILPVMTDGLEAAHLTVGKPFYAKYARVPSMEEISETLQPKVICVLIGERPGLATAESMSAYLAYRAEIGMPDSKRTVVSNIHKGGVPAVEAGAYLVELIVKMIKRQTSGVEFAREAEGSERKDHEG